MEQEYRVGSFRIDLYLTRSKIAIECDEHGHKDKDAQEEYQWQKFITEHLGCRWIRFNPHDSTFSMAKVANIVFRAIMSNA